MRKATAPNLATDPVGTGEDGEHPDMELARRIYAAWLSAHHGQTIGYVYNREAKGQEMGDLWLVLARVVRESITGLPAAKEPES